MEEKSGRNSASHDGECGVGNGYLLERFLDYESSLPSLSPEKMEYDFNSCLSDDLTNLAYDERCMA